MRSFLLLSIIIAFISIAKAQDLEPDYSFLNSSLPVDERVENLVGQMTLSEKVSQLTDYSAAIPRLNVPEYNWWNECLHGVARAGYATVFPQSITIAASFDRDLMLKVADAISDEARAKHHDFQKREVRGKYTGLDFWSPNINIFRDPRWGRGHETYGEDPYLTGELATQFIKGLQGNDEKYFKVIATAKHFAVHSGPENLRHTFDAQTSDVDLYETYLPAFEKAVKEGGVYSIMGAYNRFRGEAACASTLLLDSLLRKSWGFEGYVVSDCGAISDFHKYHKITQSSAESAALAVIRGCDLNCGFVYKALEKSVEQGLITEDDIDIAVKRLYTARFKLGMFDDPSEVPFANIPYRVTCSPEHNALAKEAAQKSIVLLKNENNILPLNSNDVKTIAVIGPNANNFESLIGNYNGIAKNPVTVYKGIKAKFEPKTKILFAEGSDLAMGISNLEVIEPCYFETESGIQGLIGEYFNNTKLEGEPAFSRLDDNIDFYWERMAPDKRLKLNNYSIRWTGYLIPPVSGTYAIGSWAMPNITVNIEPELVKLKMRNDHCAFHQEQSVELEAGKKYKVVVEYVNNLGDGDVRLKWALPTSSKIADAVEVAKQADVVVVVVGLSQRLEGEEMKVAAEGFAHGDRVSLDLPKKQRELLKALKETGKPIVLVLKSGSAISVNWAKENVDAIVFAGYSGEEGGSAVADILAGTCSPSAKLPMTFYKSADQLPDFTDYNMKGRTYRYFEGEPLYPFGYGLSYTSFEYSDISIPKTVKAGEDITVSVKVSNTGSMKGDEIVQLYLSDEEGSTPRPLHQLEGFERISLNPGETKEVTFKLSAKQFSMINANGKRVIEPGVFSVYIGGGQPNQEAYTYQVLSSKLKMKGTFKY
jgi:beta-glucosidase